MSVSWKLLGAAAISVVSMLASSRAFCFFGGPTPFGAEIFVTPSAPTPSQNVVLTVNDTFSGLTENCGHLAGVSVAQSGSTLNVQATLFVDCMAGESGPTTDFQVNLGELPIGSYTVNYASSGQGDPRLHTASLTFTVSTTLPRVIEYFSLDLNRYFMTMDPAEIAALDSGGIPGWHRTGQSFAAMEPEVGRIDLWRVCRMYGLPQAGLNSHFFSADRAECDWIEYISPDQWIIETPDAFLVPSGYLCDAGTVPLFRLFNNRPDADHRYTTSLQIRDQMIAAGWILEGYSLPGTPDVHAMCVLP